MSDKETKLEFVKLGYGSLSRNNNRYGKAPHLRGKLTLDFGENNNIDLPLAGWFKENEDGSKYVSLASSMPKAKVEETFNERDIPAEIWEYFEND